MLFPLIAHCDYAFWESVQSVFVQCKTEMLPIYDINK